MFVHSKWVFFRTLRTCMPYVNSPIIITDLIGQCPKQFLYLYKSSSILNLSLKMKNVGGGKRVINNIINHILIVCVNLTYNKHIQTCYITGQ